MMNDEFRFAISDLGFVSDFEFRIYSFGVSPPAFVAAWATIFLGR